MRSSGSSGYCRVDDQQQADRRLTDGRGSSRVWDCGSPLYDSYELAAVNHLLERHMMTLPPSCGSTSQQIVTSMPFRKSGQGNGRGSEAEAGLLLSRTTSLARSLGRRMWKRVAVKAGRNKTDEDEDDNSKEKANWKLIPVRFYALSCGTGRRVGDS